MIKKIGLLLFVAFCVVGTMQLCVYISIHFFFDKLYYYKSKAFGYYIPQEKKKMEDFGRRAEDLSVLLTDIHTTESIALSCPLDKKVNQQDDGVFRVAFIGDSYVWGQGLTNTQLAGVKLEKLLNKKIKSKVYLFGNPGDTILDNYIKYRYVERDFPKIDLYIFGMVDNDLLIQEKNTYNQDFFESFIKLCPGPVYYQPTYDPFTQNEEIPYFVQINNSFSDRYVNTCILDLVASLLPQNALYLNHDDYQDNETSNSALARYTLSLANHDLSVISMKGTLTEDEIKKQFVSKKELHPSALINTVYAQVLFAEIEKKLDL